MKLAMPRGVVPRIRGGLTSPPPPLPSGRRLVVTAAAAGSRSPMQPSTASSGGGGAAAATAASATAVDLTAPSTPSTPVESQPGSGSESGSGSEPELQASKSEEAQQFVWTKHWWPLMPLAYLRPDRPNPITLLGTPLVAWLDRNANDNANTTPPAAGGGGAGAAGAAAAPATASGGGGAWRVFADRCPHRLVPLSEGRIEPDDGTLSCAYHGWRFDGSGAPRSIPQSTGRDAEAAACRNRRACATAYPTRVEAGMLWVWPDDSPDAAETAAATAVHLSYDLRTQGQRADAADAAAASGTAAASPTAAAAPIRWFMRELSYSYEILVENVADPAHVPHTHHGLTPTIKRSAGGRMPMKQVDPAAAAAAAALPTAAAAAAASPSASPQSSPAPPPPSPSSQSSNPPLSPTTTKPSATPNPNPNPTPTSAPPGVARGMPLHWARPTGPDFEFDYLSTAGNGTTATLSLTMPHHIIYTYRLGKFEGRSELIATPIEPGRARFFTALQLAPPPANPLAALASGSFDVAMNYIMSTLDPLMMSHVMYNQLLDGDSVFLNVLDGQLQQTLAAVDAEATVRQGGVNGGGDNDGGGGGGRRHLQGHNSDGSTATTTTTTTTTTSASGGGGSGGGGFWSRLYYMPTPSDLSVVAGRKWMDERAGGGPFRARQRKLLGGPAAAATTAAVPGAAPSPDARARILSRYDQHTRHCPVCTNGLARVRRLAEAARAVQSASLLGVGLAGGALSAAAASATATAAATAATAAVPAAAAAAVPAAAVALLSGSVGVWAAAGWLAAAVERWGQRAFVFQDYVHAERD
ncbi:hypothetical protein PLESTF_000510600 [Pleodorina starrii]|nr:hypothetical protein PLESTF_000510600 [Pleodorina starrii]